MQRPDWNVHDDSLSAFVRLTFLYLSRNRGCTHDFGILN
jgi:hypothetical protein